MDQVPPQVWATAHELVQRQATNSTTSSSTSPDSRPPAFKAVGLCLAIGAGLFIGTSFVLKKVGLLRANEKYNEEAGEGYGYLKNAYWWTGMTLMIVGEVCNFVAYAFVDAILVTPLGALSVVVTTILSAIFLKERLSFVGKIGCFNCIVGSVVIVLNAPQQSSVADIQQMKSYVVTPGFLSWMGIVIAGCAFVALWVAPRYGKKTMLVYLSICSMIGGLSVVATQGLGSAVVAQAGGKPQFNQWFLYVVLVFVVATLLTEIIYLNKALNLFNAALVTPTYYVFFTSATIVTSAILFQGFKGTPLSIATVVMGFLQICSGVVLLQMSKSAKDVPDSAVFKGDLDQIREIGDVEQPESEPKADAIRGTAALIRRISVSRQKMEQDEARRLMQDKKRDRLEPVGENEIVEWDGLRRRTTVIGGPQFGAPQRRKTIHPPLGMSRMPDPEEEEENSDFLDNIRNRAQTMFHRRTSHGLQSPPPAVPLDDITPRNSTVISPDAEQLQLQKHRRPPQQNKRQFSFANFLRHNSGSRHEVESTLSPRHSMDSRRGSIDEDDKRLEATTTEEEKLGLVQGDRSPDKRPILSQTSSNKSIATQQNIKTKTSDQLGRSTANNISELSLGHGITDQRQTSEGQRQIRFTDIPLGQSDQRQTQGTPLPQYTSRDSFIDANSPKRKPVAISEPSITNNRGSQSDLLTPAHNIDSHRQDGTSSGGHTPTSIRMVSNNSSAPLPGQQRGSDSQGPINNLNSQPNLIYGAAPTTSRFESLRNAPPRQYTGSSPSSMNNSQSRLSPPQRPDNLGGRNDSSDSITRRLDERRANTGQSHASSDIVRPFPEYVDEFNEDLNENTPTFNNRKWTGTPEQGPRK